MAKTDLTKRYYNSQRPDNIKIDKEMLNDDNIKLHTETEFRSR